ncbi:type II secretion system protein GspI [Stenotrophomonas sp. Betaine-02u-21]|nr:type II secretion system protein GspI [Stenotrophomonas sp. Betaine-02u-23]PKH73454.1 type II secretion system protein GspI [Stenotrophomonas sp. Betaine-02u-21]PKH95308.1 type II secretion system protein GspI [Stenotrophomonas sp. Bg11-02]
MQTHCKGFSLLEMLVALAILALVVAGLLNLAGESMRTAVRMEDRVFAGIVADNLAAEALVVQRDTLARTAQGTESLADRRWSWQRTVIGGGEGQESLMRVEIRVSTPDGGEAASATVFR